MIKELETLALRSIALKDSEYFQRKVMRYYSEHFHTPLLEVYNLPWPFVFTNYIEHILEKNYSTKDFYELVVDICYPEKRVSEEKETQEWIKRIEEEEEARRQRERNPHIEASPDIEGEEEEIIMESSSFSHLDSEMEDE
jgi:Ran GTPase-activating protein (RanGAP) involved in mRNA processing and transport